MSNKAEQPLFTCIFIAVAAAALTNPLFSFCQPATEGIATVTYKTAKDIKVITEIAAKGDTFRITQKQNGSPRYSGFIVTLSSRTLITLSDTSKKIAIQYHFDTLLHLYAAHGLKEGYEPFRYPDYSFSVKVKPSGAWVAETPLHHHTVWVADNGFFINPLIPFLQLIGSWNEANGAFQKPVQQTEVIYKANKKKSEVVVTFQPTRLRADEFRIPDNYTLRDLGAWINENRRLPDVQEVVRNFAGF
ncbi:MAG: hypothetical protein RML37_11050 [Chitinophagales bacterium]|nr:hypothetical protein [Chitinophagales bacterium]